METCLHPYFILNNAFVSSCDFNPDVFQKNENMYEVVRVMNGHILFLDEHVQRLMQSAKNMGFKPAFQAEMIKNSLIRLVDLNRVDSGNIKIILTEKKNEAPYHFAAYFIPHAYPNAQMYANGVSVSLIHLARSQPNTKLHSQNYKEKVNACMKMDEVYEVLLTRNGKITEGSRSNVFFIKDNCIYTAPDDCVLKGITREKVLEICHELQFTVKLETIRTEALTTFDACFLSGTSPKVLPVAQIKDVVAFQPDHPLVKAISKQYDALLAKQAGRNEQPKSV